jgi:hypothetical protein
MWVTNLLAGRQGTQSPEPSGPKIHNVIKPFSHPSVLYISLLSSFYENQNCIECYREETGTATTTVNYHNLHLNKTELWIVKCEKNVLFSCKYFRYGKMGCRFQG